jgi:hypothetical protein
VVGREGDISLRGNRLHGTELSGVEEAGERPAGGGEGQRPSPTAKDNVREACLGQDRIQIRKSQIESAHNIFYNSIANSIKNGDYIFSLFC